MRVISREALWRIWAGVMGHLVGRDNAVLHQLGVPGNRGERGLELMGDVGGKLLPQLGGLLQLLVLAADGRDKGGDLRIGGDIPRVFEVGGHLGNRTHQPPGQQVGQHRRHHQQHRHRHHQHRHRLDEKAPEADRHPRQPQDVAVRQQLGIIIGIVAHRLRLADGVPLAGRKGLLDLFPLQVVFHRRFVGAGVVKHFAAGGNQRHP